MIVGLLATLLLPSGACRRTPPGLVAAADGVALDERTGLEWTSRDVAAPLAWGDAARHCRALAIAARRDWRLPALAEIETLYDPRFTEPCGDRPCHLAPAIRLGGPYVWTDTPRAGGRFYFDFGYGTSFSPGVPPTLGRRTISVATPGRAAPTAAPMAPRSIVRQLAARLLRETLERELAARA